MGEVEIEAERGQLIIHSHIITYGNAANTDLTESIRAEIETMWNEPQAEVTIGRNKLLVVFRITSSYHSAITDLEIYQNVDPGNNYFRIEEFAHGNISFVDGLPCNSGYPLSADVPDQAYVHIHVPK